MKKILITLISLLSFLSTQAQTAIHSALNGHSHNDYNQNIPLLRAYYAGMGSIEADVFLQNGKLLVAHDIKEVTANSTLQKMYLEPIAGFFAKHKGSVYPDQKSKLQLVIDIKENYGAAIPALIEALKPYLEIFDAKHNANAVKIVISGDMPAPADFKKYPDYIYFDGRPETKYTAAELERVAMISGSLSDYTKWNGKGTPTPQDAVKLAALIQQAHHQQKPFRFWATKDSPNTWIELEKLGADWIGTDHPEQLQHFYSERAKTTFINPTKGYAPYRPTYKSDGGLGKVKNVILLIGDGMGLAQIQAALTANFGLLNLTFFKHLGLSRTEASNSDITDSAAGATAFGTGEKTNNRYISVDPAGKALKSIPEVIADYGMKTGIISSGDITDATPAVFYAHQPERSMSREIAADLGTSKVDILVGSNRRSFMEGANQHLLDTLAKKGFTLSRTLKEFEAAKSGKQLVLLDDSVTRPVKAGRGIMLRTSLLKTIDLLSANKRGFFIMAEGAQIDYGGHANDLPYAVTELHDFDQTVAEALRFADQDGETLVIVTADHETGGLSLLDANAKQGTVRGNFSTDDHTNIMVPVFAYGPGAANFIGVYPNTEIFKKIIRTLKR
ncbi:alkaline phosphatase [Pedobacter duraquae]|nr:alkaline phosphatase [Pedobacter duraquae]